MGAEAVCAEHLILRGAIQRVSLARMVEAARAFLLDVVEAAGRDPVCHVHPPYSVGLAASARLLRFPKVASSFGTFRQIDRVRVVKRSKEASSIST